MERTIKEASVEGVRIKQKPTKHVVYAVQMTWSDGQVNVVSRRYSEFFDLMKKLTEKFEESGKKGKEKIIPTLSGKRMGFLGNSAMKRLDCVTSFTKKLFLLPPTISQSQIVHDFFKPTFADIRSSRRSTKRGKKGRLNNKQMKKKLVKQLSITGPIAFEEYFAIDDLKNQTKGGLDLKKGQVVEVIDKNESGWWFVSIEGEQGWVPKSYLEHEDNDHENDSTITFEPGSGEIYVTTKKYKAQHPDELSFDVGVHLQIIEKHNDGWWKATYCGREGMVPNNHLKLIGQANKEDTRSNSEAKAEDSTGGEKKKIEENGKKKVFIKNSGRQKSRSDIDDNTLKRLRLSACSIPEEHGILDMPRRKSAADIPKIHLQVKNSSDGGWVPQDHVSRSASFSAESPKGTKVKKNSSFSGGIFKSRAKKAEDRSVSTLADMFLNEFVMPRRNSDSQIQPYQPNKAKQESPSAISLTVPQNLTAPAEGEQELSPTLQHKKVQRTSLISPQDGTDLLPRKAKSLPRKLSPRLNKRRETEDLSKPYHEQTHQQIPRLSLPDVNIGEKYQALQSTPSLKEWELLNDLDEESSDSDEGSIEDLILTYEDLEHEQTEGKDFRKDSGFSDSSSLPRYSSKVYIAKADYNGIEDNEEIDLSKGQQVVVLDKIESGWWLVESNGIRGWAPSNYLVEFQQEPEPEEDKIITNEEKEEEPAPSSISVTAFSEGNGLANKKSAQSTNQADIYIAIANYNGVKEDGEVNLIKDQKVLVLQKTSEPDWWLVESEGEVGWAPSNYLEEISKNDEKPDYYHEECREVPDVAALQLSKGSRFEVLDSHNNGQYVLVRVPAKVGWLPVSSFDEALLPHCTTDSK